MREGANSLFCNNCGKEINDDAKFCKFCGTKVENIYVTEQPVASEQVNNNQVLQAIMGEKKPVVFPVVKIAMLIFLILNVVAFFMPVVVGKITGEESELIDFMKSKCEFLSFGIPLIASAMAAFAAADGIFKLSSIGDETALIVGILDLVWVYNYTKWLPHTEIGKALFEKGSGTSMYNTCGWVLIICSVIHMVLSAIMNTKTEQKTV
jgi:hypothetical protein